MAKFAILEETKVVDGTMVKISIKPEVEGLALMETKLEVLDGKQVEVQAAKTDFTETHDYFVPNGQNINSFASNVAKQHEAELLALKTTMDAKNAQPQQIIYQDAI